MDFFQVIQGAVLVMLACAGLGCAVFLSVNGCAPIVCVSLLVLGPVVGVIAIRDG